MPVTFTPSMLALAMSIAPDVVAKIAWPAVTKGSPVIAMLPLSIEIVPDVERDWMPLGQFVVMLSDWIIVAPVSVEVEMPYTPRTVIVPLSRANVPDAVHQ